MRALRVGLRAARMQAHSRHACASLLTPPSLPSEREPFGWLHAAAGGGAAGGAHSFFTVSAAHGALSGGLASWAAVADTRRRSSTAGAAPHHDRAAAAAPSAPPGSAADAAREPARDGDGRPANAEQTETLYTGPLAVTLKRVKARAQADLNPAHARPAAVPHAPPRLPLHAPARNMLTGGRAYCSAARSFYRSPACWSRSWARPRSSPCPRRKQCLKRLSWR
jgi:hypothetical protein